ncbi:MAG: PAS domain S-box protein, partial [Thermodesulfobacteriota bacterium]
MFLAALAVVFLPVYLYFHLSPSLRSFVTKSTEVEAIRVATHLSSMAVRSGKMRPDALPKDIDRIVDNAKSDFNIRKLKIFSDLGEVIYSTDKDEIGQVNRNSYFHEIVAAGKNFTKVVQKESASMEGQIFTVDVVETYVPVMRNGKFIGAFEIYYDITARVDSLNRMIEDFYQLVLPFAFLILIAMSFTLIRFRESFSKRLAIEKKLRDNEKRYKTLFESSNDAIVVFDEHSIIREVNERACQVVGFNHDQLIGTSIHDLPGEASDDEWADGIKKALAGEDVIFESNLRTIEGKSLDVEVKAWVTGRKKSMVQAVIRDVTDEKQRQREVKRGYQTQTVLNKLLHLSLENLTLTETLELFIYYITSFPWLELEPKGAIFLVGEKPGVLELKAHRGLNEDLLVICNKVPFGKCLCGRCAMTGEVVFANCINDYHDNTYDGIVPHGHYCVPILSVNRKLVGVFTLYIQPDTKRDKLAEETLEAAASVIAGVIQRKKAEEELQLSKDKLEVRVQERTIELEEANIQLGQELSERNETERALAGANQEKDDLIVNLFEIMYEMLANRDHSTFEHALRVAEISRRVGVEMGLAEEDMEV